MENIVYHSIGTIHSPFTERKGMPIQPAGAKGVDGFIEINSEYAAGLSDLAGFSHLYLLYHFHLSEGYELRVKPFLDEKMRGLFATRAPRRPNAIGLSIVKLIKIEGNVLRIQDVDILNGTPLLDIKPYVVDFDSRADTKSGWVENVASEQFNMRSDDRFL